MSASPCRDSAGKLAITTGVWTVDKNAFNQFSVWSDECRCTALVISQADAALIAEAGTITNATGRTPAELLKERDDARQQMDEWRTNCLKIRERSEVQKSENERLVELVRELREIVMHVTSLNMGKPHMVMIPGDDEPCFAQRKEWCDWMLDLAEKALAKSEGI
jgi:hypothetical protein